MEVDIYALQEQLRVQSPTSLVGDRVEERGGATEGVIAQHC